MNKYKIVAIGAGAGGLQCVTHAASRGAPCAIIDMMEVGGECLLYGCIPTKSMVRSLDIYRLIKNSAKAGIEVSGGVAVNFPGIMTRQREIVNGIVQRIHKGLSSMKVDFYNGIGSIINPNKVMVALNNSGSGNKKQVVLETENILIATGSFPTRISIPGTDLPGVLTNREIFDLKDLPKGMVIIGCGYIGVEFATIFASMGSRVTMLEKYDFLMDFDQKFSQTIRQRLMEQQKVSVETGVNILEIQETDNGHCKVFYDKDGQQRSAQGEIVLMAAGRTPYTDNLVGSDIKIAMDGSGIRVNEYLETSVPGIYAVGDVLNGAMTAYTAGTEGEVAAGSCLGRRTPMDYSAIPRCVFTYPPYACVGLTEDKARLTEGLDFGLAEYPFQTTPMAEIMNETEGFTRIIYEKGSGRILGGHVLGADADELIAEITLAVHEKSSLRDLAYLLHFHPSLSENLQRAAKVGLFKEETEK